jgi:adenine-specific DNA-methyltransferase
MKYMGAKRVLLERKLGKVIQTEINFHGRFVDLFSGSASVSHYVAQLFPVETISVDLQNYSKYFADSILLRTSASDKLEVIIEWIKKSIKLMKASRTYQKLRRDLPDLEIKNLQTFVFRARELCKTSLRAGTIFSAYGGYYFNPYHALFIDYLVKYIPQESEVKSVCMASIIEIASLCIVSPGHTAQPLKPKMANSNYYFSSWSRNFSQLLFLYAEKLLKKYSIKKGEAHVADSLNFVQDNLRENDLVFVDPPYSSEQYSRFYHVYETIATGTKFVPEGTGRYPSQKDRKVSLFSQKSKAKLVTGQLIDRIADSGSSSIWTFPKHNCTNGLSGVEIFETAKHRFRSASFFEVENAFSTLGGQKDGTRSARRAVVEMIMIFKA